MNEQRNVKKDKASHDNNSLLYFQSLIFIYIHLHINKQQSFLEIKLPDTGYVDTYYNWRNRDHSTDNVCIEDFHTQKFVNVLSVMSSLAGV